jgi:hypothetical protein
LFFISAFFVRRLNGAKLWPCLNHALPTLRTRTAQACPAFANPAIETKSGNIKMLSGNIKMFVGKDKDIVFESAGKPSVSVYTLSAGLAALSSKLEEQLAANAIVVTDQLAKAALATESKLETAANASASAAELRKVAIDSLLGELTAKVE